MMEILTGSSGVRPVLSVKCLHGNNNVGHVTFYRNSLTSDSFEYPII